MSSLKLHETLNELNQSVVFALADRVDLREAHRIAQLLARRELAFLERTQYVPRDILEQIQVRKLRRILKSATKTPYWSTETGMDVGSFTSLETPQELESFPVLTREVLKSRKSHDFINPALSKKRLHSTSTSGSTGEPLELLLDTAVLPGRLARFRRMLRWLGAGDAPYIRLLPRVPLGFSNLPYLSTKNRPFDTNFLKYVLRSASRFKKPPVIDTFPSHVVRLAQLAEEQNVPKGIFAGFVSGGEAPLSHMYDAVQNAFDCPVVPYYGATEFEVIGQACHMSKDTLHLNAEHFYVEILDDAHNPVPDGTRGKVTITSLEHEAFPFIRYQLGDFGTMIPGICDCGRTLPRIVLEGRTSQVITLANGVTISYFDFRRPVITQRNIWRFQFVHEAPGVVVVRIVPTGEGISEREVARIQRELQVLLGPSARVALEIVQDIAPAANGKRTEYVRHF